MSEFVWRDQYKVMTREITRGEQFDVWETARRLGWLEATGIADSDERIAELIAQFATVAVYDCHKNKWQETDKVFDVSLPITADHFRDLPLSLANGWIEAALKENGGLLNVLSFPSASVRTTNAGSAPPSESEPSKT